MADLHTDSTNDHIVFTDINDLEEQSHQSQSYDTENDVVDYLYGEVTSRNFAKQQNANEAKEKCVEVEYSSKKYHFIKECPILMDKFTEGEVVLALPCNHIFKKASLNMWLNQKQTCPICRHNLIDNKDELKHNITNTSNYFETRSIEYIRNINSILNGNSRNEQLDALANILLNVRQYSIDIPEID